MGQSKSIFSDFLQAYPFWLFDVAPIDAVSVPVLTPLFGFASITAPEITVETRDIPEGNYFFTRKVVKRANVSKMTLTRGTAFYDSDFWRWMRATLEGNTNLSSTVPNNSFFRAQIGGPTPRRVLVLVHFFSRNPFGTGKLGTVAGIGAVTALAGVIGGSAMAGTGVGALKGGLIAAGQVGLGTIASSLGKKYGIGPFEFAARVPAKAFILSGCIPTRYKVASDFDAKSSEISIAELDIEIEVMEEVGLLA